MSGSTIYAEDARVPVLEPGTERTKAGRLGYVSMTSVGMAVKIFPRYNTAMRRAQRQTVDSLPRQFRRPCERQSLNRKVYGDRVADVACMPHIQCKLFFFDANKGSPSARETFDRIAERYTYRYGAAES